MTKIKLNSLHNLTIIIPSFQRENCVRRQIEFWRENKYQVEILDGSYNPLYKSNKKFDLVRYWCMPGVSIEERLLFASGLISSKYAALLPDDEFFLPSTIEQCMKFLDQNLDYGTCKGQASWFNYFNGNVLGGNAYPGLKEFHVRSSNNLKRLLEHMVPYEMGSLYSIQRSEILKANLQTIGEGNSFSTAAAAEIQISLISSYVSKIKVLDEILWLRSEENPNIWWSLGSTTFKNWWRNKSYKEEHSRFITSIINGIKLTSKRLVINKKLRNEIILVLNKYSDWIEQTFESSFRVKLKLYFSRILKSIFGFNFFNKIKSQLYKFLYLINKLNFPNKKMLLLEHLKSEMKVATKERTDEIKLIVRKIKDSHKVK